MTSFKHASYALLSLLSLSAALFSCKHNPDNPTPVPPVAATTTITSIDPATAPVGSTIAVNGTNFSSDPASNTVLVGGVQATIVSASPTQLIVTVPVGATSGPVTVTAGGQTAQSPATNSFTLALSPLKPVVKVQGTLYGTRTWRRDSVYQLLGLVYVGANATLNIEPGTVIRGADAALDPYGASFKAGNVNAAGTLIVERGGKLVAKGTAAQPITFTSNKAIGQRQAGDWGGIVLIGKAALNRPAATTFPGGVRGTAETYSQFDDNSGTLQYVRIEYAGTSQPSVPTSKLNGLSLYGVGYNTTLDHIQVSYSSADAFSWFGGTANLKNLVAFQAVGDDWSSDWGYLGKVQFGVALRNPGVSDLGGSNGFSSQNFDNGGENAGGTLTKQNGFPQTAPIFANMSNLAFTATPTVGTVGSNYYQSGMYLRGNTAISIYNSLIYGYPEGLRLDGTATGTLANAQAGTLDLRGIVLANVVTPVVGAGSITNDQANAYFAAADRSNQIIASTELASVLLKATNFSLTAPSFLPPTGSPLLTGAVTGGKVADSFFTPVSYRGAFGTDNWVSDWTNFNPQNTDYDR